MSQAGSFQKAIPAGTYVETLEGNAGGKVGPDGTGNINVVGDGTTITIVGDPGDNTLTASVISGSAEITITGDTGGPLTSNTFTFTGGTTGITFNGSGTTETLEGTLVVANGGTGDVSFTAYAPICGGTTTTGVLQSASTGISNSGYVLTSTGSSSLPTWQEAAATGIVTIDGNSGSVTGSTVTIETANTTVKTSGSGTTMTIDFQPTSGGNLLLGAPGSSISSGFLNSGYGIHSLESISSAENNSGYGPYSLQKLTSGQENSAFGVNALNAITTTNANSAFGLECLWKCTGTGNTAIGDQAGENIASSGSYNCLFGYGAGQNYTTTESSNIVISADGVVGESNVIRIGTQGSGSSQQNACYIAGIDGVNLSTANIVTESSTQLGTAVLTGGTGITIDATSTPNEIIINASGGGGAGTITGNDGTPEAQVAGNWDIVTSNATVTFAGSAGTETLNFQGDQYNNIILGALPAGITSGSGDSVGVGFNALNSITTDENCVAIGAFALQSLVGSNGNNVAVGGSCLTGLTTGSNNVAVGAGVGSGFFGLGTGSYNVLIGNSAATSYSGSESSNILINNGGSNGENNTLRIGAGTGSGNQQLASSYISGINGVNVSSSTQTVVTMTSGSDQLGTAVLTSGSGISITPGANTITIAATGGGGAGTITGNTGGAISQSAGNWNLVTANTNIGVVGSGSTLTMDWTGDANSNILVGATGAITTGENNTGFGNLALDSIVSGSNNTAVGEYALGVCIGGNNNTAIGSLALSGIGGGAGTDSGNTAIGYNALTTLAAGGANTGNTAIGYNAGQNAEESSYLTLLGYQAGINYDTTEANNILINSNGVVSESNVLRICDAANTSTGTGLSASYIGGITGVSVTGAAVIVSTGDQLGVTVSSRKFKDNIEDMGSASEAIYNLRPTTFTYKGSTETRYGLIAEEVAEVMPNLVVYDKSGDPQTVMYHELPALLLNEIQKLRKEIDELKKGK